jgi:hypothetical protein
MNGTITGLIIRYLTLGFFQKIFEIRDCIPVDRWQRPELAGGKS